MSSDQSLSTSLRLDLSRVSTFRRVLYHFRGSDSSTISVAAILPPFLRQRFFYHFCGSGVARSSVQVPRLAGGQGGVTVLGSHHRGRVLEYRRRLQIEGVRGREER